tara:strand:+ start:4389 stop:4742 length:354 start_codon:yes stop_codon:yes gene_type:complete
MVITDNIKLEEKMAIIDTVTEVSFGDTMINHGFTREGAAALFWYLDDVSEGGGQDIEMDPVAFRCEFSEYTDFEDLKNDYDCETIEELQDRTVVIPFEGYDLEAKAVVPKGWIVQQF